MNKQYSQQDKPLPSEDNCSSVFTPHRLNSSGRPAIRNSRLMLRMIAAFLFSGILLTGVLLFSANALVSRNIAQTSNQAAEAQLVLASRTAYYVLTDIYGDFYSLWAKNPDMQKALAATAFTSADEEQISNLLDAAAFPDTLVDSVYLINIDAGRIVSNRLPATSLESFTDQGAIKLFQQFEEKYATARQEVLFPRQAVYLVDGQQIIHNYISLIYTTMADDNRLHAGIIINIDQTKLASLINYEEEAGQMIIVNRSGQIICDNSGTSFTEQLPSDSLFQTIAASESVTGSLVLEYEGEQALVSYQKAATLGFYFLNIIPYALLMQPVRQTNQIMVMLFGAAILLSLLISVLSACRIYRPLDRLIRLLQRSPAVNTDTSLEEYAYLQAAFGNMVAHSEQASLLRLLQGSSIKQMLEMLDFNRPAFLVATVAAYPDTQDQHNRTDDVWLDAVCQIARRTIRLPAAVLPGCFVAILFNADAFDEVMLDWLVSQLSDLQQAVRQATGRHAAVGFGNAVHDPAAIKISLQNAQTAMQYAVALEPSQIVPYSEIQNHPLAASQNRVTIALAIDAFIQDHFTQPGFSLEEISEHIGLSVGYLRQIFKLERGIPLNDYIIACRIRKACDLLNDTDMTAKDIAESVGYLDSRYFYTLFKKKTSMTTEEYRKAMRQETSY